MSKAAPAPVSSFEGKVFHDASFRNHEFADKVSFKNAQFFGTTDFRGARFKDVTDFNGARFFGDAAFTGIHFHHDAHFSGTEFNGDSDFSGTTFHAWGLFDKSSFKSRMIFREACFRGAADFSEAGFADGADLSKSRFIAYAHFAGAGFQGKADFTDAAIDCKAIFSGARFQNEAAFNGCRFSHPVTFKLAVFSAEASFERVTFAQLADFSGARFSNAFVLTSPQTDTQTETRPPVIRFESVVLDNPEKVRFSNMSFERITLMGTNLRGIKLENPRWPRTGMFKKRAVLYDEIQKDKPDPQKLAGLYREIRANLKKAGTTADLGDLFYSEMEVRRKAASLRRYFSPYSLLWLTCGYGRRPARLVIVAAIAALAYWVWGNS